MDVQGGGVVVGDGSSGQGCWRGEAHRVAAVGETCKDRSGHARRPRPDHQQLHNGSLSYACRRTTPPARVADSPPAELRWQRCGQPWPPALSAGFKSTPETGTVPTGGDGPAGAGGGGVGDGAGHGSGPQTLRRHLVEVSARIKRRVKVVMLLTADRRTQGRQAPEEVLVPAVFVYLNSQSTFLTGGT